MVVSWENEGPESGEYFFHGRLWQKCSLKVDNSAQNWPSQHVNSHFLIDQPRASSLGAAVELLFFLPPVWAFSHNSIFQSDFRLDFFHIFQTFVSHLFSSCMRLPPSLSFWPTFQFLSVCQYILMWRTGGPFFFRLCSQKIANACAVSHNISYSGIVTVLSTIPNS